KWIYGQDRDELHDRWIDLQKQAKSGPVTTKAPELAEYLTYWLQEIVAPNLAPLTCATYETLTRLYLMPSLGNKRLDKLTVRDVQTWLNKVRTTCQCCAQGKDTRRAEQPVAAAQSTNAAPRCSPCARSATVELLFQAVGVAGFEPTGSSSRNNNNRAPT